MLFYWAPYICVIHPLEPMARPMLPYLASVCLWLGLPPPQFKHAHFWCQQSEIVQPQCWRVKTQRVCTSHKHLVHFVFSIPKQASCNKTNIQIFTNVKLFLSDYSLFSLTFGPPLFLPPLTPEGCEQTWRSRSALWLRMGWTYWAVMSGKWQLRTPCRKTGMSSFCTIGEKE